MATGNRYRYIGNVAREFQLENGKLPWLAPGDFINLSDEDLKTYKEDIDSGILIDAPKVKE